MSLTQRLNILSLICFVFLSFVPFCAVGDDSLIVTDAGNVGIGTGTPESKLDVNGNLLVQGSVSAGYITVQPQNSTVEGGEIKLKGSGAYQDWYLDSYYDAFRIHNSVSGEILRILPNGNTGIRMVPDAAYALDVNGVIRAGSWTSDSDARWKENIEPIENALDKVTRLRGVAYDWIDPSRGEGRQIGVIAQEVEEIFPEVVHTDSQGYKSVEYAKLVAPLIEAVKTLKEENERLSEENQILKQANRNIDARVAEIERLLLEK